MKIIDILKVEGFRTTMLTVAINLELASLCTGVVFGDVLSTYVLRAASVTALLVTFGCNEWSGKHFLASLVLSLIILTPFTVNQLTIPLLFVAVSLAVAPSVGFGRLRDGAFSATSVLTGGAVAAILCSTSSESIITYATVYSVTATAFTVLGVLHAKRVNAVNRVLSELSDVNYKRVAFPYIVPLTVNVIPWTAAVVKLGGVTDQQLALLVITSLVAIHHVLFGHQCLNAVDQ